MGVALQNWSELLILFGAGQGLLLAVLLFSKKRNRTANVFFAILMLLVSFKLLSPYLYSFENNFLIITLKIFSESLILLFAPLHFLYSYLIIYPREKTKLRLYLFFLPFTDRQSCRSSPQPRGGRATESGLDSVVLLSFDGVRPIG